MKILRIIPSMNPKLGGPSQGIRNSIPALRDLGIENEVVCLDNPQEPYLQDSPFAIHALGASKTGWAYNKTLQFWLEQHLTEYDIVIIHGLWLYHSYIGIKVFEKLKKRSNAPQLFIMPHGMLDPWFQRAESRKLKALRNEIYWALIEKKVVNSADGLLFTCEQELLLARETFKGYRPKKEQNIGYGIQAPPVFTKEMQNAFYEKLPDLRNQPFLLFLSRIHPKKGIDLLINAYLELENSHTNIPDLVIAGPINGEYADAMQNMAKSSKKIHFTGMLQGEAKWGAFYGCEAFILPSHQENFGISVVEALACGKPALITDQVNIFTEIKEGGGGFVEADTYEGIKKLLLKWISQSAEEKEKISQKAMQVYSKYFTVEQAAKRLKYIFSNQKKYA
jgi:glycosyltransferase involved in cell wall biosynthesis